MSSNVFEKWFRICFISRNFSTQTREGWEGALKILSTDINDFRSPAQMSCNPPWGGKKQALNSVCWVFESTHVNTCVACRRERIERYANKERYLPRLAGEKEIAELRVRDSVIDQFIRFAVLCFDVYFMCEFGSVYAYTRAALMTRGAWYKLMLTHPYLCTSPIFYFTLLYQRESVRNVEAQRADPTVS